jgi:phenylacetate-CoA ligase
MNDTRQNFISTPLDALLAEHQAISPEEKVLAQFQRCVAEVPAYRHFLGSRGINPAGITSYGAFQALPLMSKVN